MNAIKNTFTSPKAYALGAGTAVISLFVLPKAKFYSVDSSKQMRLGIGIVIASVAAQAAVKYAMPFGGGGGGDV